MDFLRNHAPLAGGDTRYGGTGGSLADTPNLANHAKPAYHAKPSQSFLIPLP